MRPITAVPEKWLGHLERSGRGALERVIARFLLGQRWFAGKARSVDAVHITDWTVVPCRSAQVFWTLLSVRFRDGGTDLYSLPLAVVHGHGSAQLLESVRGRVVARLTGPRDHALLIDALADEAASEAIESAIETNNEFAARGGCIRASATAVFADLRGPLDSPLRAEPGPTTSSNSLVIYGRRLMLKLFRRLESGTNPDLEIGRFLTETTSFRAIPRTAGFIEFHRRDKEPMTLAIL
jgi:maltose alpha-D-glucosyltransferase / alpha-amylase